MTEPRRAVSPDVADPRRRGFVLIGAVAVVLIVGLVVTGLVLQNQTGSAQTAGSAPAATTSTTTTTTTAPATAGSSPVGSDPATPDTLVSCRAQVGRAEEVIAAAVVGADHWHQHVQAQTDGNDGKITVAEMNAIFARTRAAGSDDMLRYGEALLAYKPQPDACSASGQAPAQLATCRARLDALGQAMPAGEAVMLDWQAHLKAMNESREMHKPEAGAVWDQMWRAAPKNLNAFAAAKATLDTVPACS